MSYHFNFSRVKTKKECYSNFYIGKARGAILLLLLLGNAQAAQIVFNPILLNCDRLSVEVVPKPYTGNVNSTPCPECCPGEIACNRIEYQVFLRATPGSPIQLNGNFTLSYSELYITLHLNRANAVISYINIPQTESCLAGFLSGFSDDYQADLVEDEVSLRLSSLNGEILPGIPFENFRSNVPLFSIIIDAYPGETFGIDCQEFTYSSAQDGCAGVCPGRAPALFPMPNTTNTSLTLSLGDIVCGAEDFIDLPVIVSSTLTGTINLFDFAVSITGTAPDGFFASPTVIDVLPGTSPDIRVMTAPNGNGHVVNVTYAAQDATPFSGTDMHICTIRISRPPNLCQGYTTSALLAPGRIRMNSLNPGASGCMAVQTDKTTAECVVPEVAICGDFQFIVTTESILSSCTELKAYATLSWDPVNFGGLNTLEFEHLKARIDFGLQSGATISDVEIVGFTCPTSGNLCQDPCLDFSGNAVSLCIETSSLMVTNGARIIITFDAPDGCVQNALVRKVNLKLKNTPPVCQPDINPAVGFPYCAPTDAYITGDIATENNCWVTDVEVEINANPVDPLCADIVEVNSPDCALYISRCLCPDIPKYTVTPVKDDNPLNGVTTYDLVLISKHILGQTPLGSPYKMIAADANHSNSITTFDIVEIRKLILGIYQDFPANTSWRFFDKNHVFPMPPFIPGNQPETYKHIYVSALPYLLADFIAVKIGDVNNTAIANSCVTPNDACDAFERPAGEFKLLEPRHSALKAGQYYTFPVRSGSDKPVIAWQTALRFDPELVELIGPSIGDLAEMSGDNFNLNQSGEGSIRALWFAQQDVADEQALQPGQVLFNLTFRIKKDVAEFHHFIQMDESNMPNLGWTNNGVAYRLTTAAGDPIGYRGDAGQDIWPVLVNCMPNPTSGAVSFEMAPYPKAQRAQLNILDAFGRRIWWRDLSRETGSLQISVPEAANWPAGVYHWELRHDKNRERGTFIRQ